MCVQIFAHFKNWIVFCYQVLRVFFKYILDISPLSDTHFINIFSQSVACLYIFLTVSLWVYYAFGVLYKKSLPKDKSQRFSPMFSSIILLGFFFFFYAFASVFFLSFYVLHSGLWFILTYRLRFFFFFILHMNVHFPLNSPSTLSKINYVCVHSLLCSAVMNVHPFSSFTYYLDYSSLIVILTIKECESTQLHCFPIRPSSFLWSFRSGGRGWTKPQGPDVALQVLWCNPTGSSPITPPVGMMTHLCSLLSASNVRPPSPYLYCNLCLEALPLSAPHPFLFSWLTRLILQLGSSCSTKAWSPSGQLRWLAGWQSESPTHCFPALTPKSPSFPQSVNRHLTVSSSAANTPGYITCLL